MKLYLPSTCIAWPLNWFFKGSKLCSLSTWRVTCFALFLSNQWRNLYLIKVQKATRTRARLERTGKLRNKSQAASSEISYPFPGRRRPPFSFSDNCFCSASHIMTRLYDRKCTTVLFACFGTLSPIYLLFFQSLFRFFWRFCTVILAVSWLLEVPQHLLVLSPNSAKVTRFLSAYFDNKT